MVYEKRNQYKTSSTSLQSPTSPAPVFTNTSPPTNNNSGDSPSLYLFTFLATLFLLLTICCGIVSHSFIIRRRAHRSATVVGDFGNEPRFYDAWVQPSSGEEKWEGIMPISARITSNDSSMLCTSRTVDANATNMITSAHTIPFLNCFPQWRRFYPASPTSNSYNQSPLTAFSLSHCDVALGGLDQNGNIQVSVLVTMPSPKSKLKNGAEIEVVPEIVVGIAQLSCGASRSAGASTPSKLRRVDD